MAVRGLTLFSGGTLALDRSITLYRTGMGKTVRTPIGMALVETDDGWILFDTGLDPRGLEDPTGTWGDHIRPLVVDFEAHHDIRSHLAAAGVAPDAIRYLVNSHLHYDHTGGNRFFPNAEWVVQKAEYRFARFPDSFAAGPYLSDHFGGNRSGGLRLVEGDTAPVDGVSLLFTPGHTPGHQSMVVDLPESGPAVLTGDAIFCSDNITLDRPSGNCWNPARAMESMHQLTHLAAVTMPRARLMILHDPAVWETLKPWPHVYR